MKILGHRKVLLKGIEDLRKNKRVTISLQAPLSPSKTTNEAINQYQDGVSVSAGAAPRAQNVYESLDESDGAPKVQYAPRIPMRGVDQSVMESNEEEESKKVHWSHIEPLQAQQEKRGLKNDVDALHHSNPADGMIDEEEERRLFQEAVAQWRGCGV